MQHSTHATRSNGAPLDDQTIAVLRRLISERRTRPLVELLGVSGPAIERAAAGGHVLRGTATLIKIGLEKLRDAGELPPEMAVDVTA